MLTNNKKSFVRSISMLLAMLMVLAVCLTGCGNKAADEALTKAEEAQNAADAAQGTADAAKTLADEVKAALADYLKTADAVTEAKVNELIDAALADGVATAADVEALAAKVTAHLGTAHLTKDEVTALIKAEVAANAVKDAMTKAEVLEILKSYYTKDEMDAKLKTYFGEFDAETVHKMLKDVEKAMNEEEWDEASAVVIETIDDMQTLMTEIFTKTYTQANMKKVNELLKPLGIVAFPTSGNKLVKIAGAEAQAKFQKNLEYTILRVASVEKMNELKAAVKAALDVPTFEKQLAALEQQLYDLGDLVQYGAYSGNTFTATKWPTADGTYIYHDKTYAKNTAKETQVVTLNDKAGYYTWIDAYDALYTEYIADGALSVAQAEGKTVKNIFTKPGANNTTLVEVDTAATKSGYTKVGATVVHADMTYVNMKAGVTPFAANTVYALPTTVFAYDLTAVGEKVTNYKATGMYGYDGNEAVYSDADNASDMALAYAAIVKQLQECQAAANEANTIFDAFQHDVVWDDSGLKTVQTDYSKVTDAQLLEYLAASMCEFNGVTVHKDNNNADCYLDPQVNKEMAESYALNGKTDAGIKEYPLYLQMKDKAFDLLWVKYKTQASEWADQILKDYISIVYEAKANDTIADHDITGAITAIYADTTDPAAALAALAGAMTAGGENTAATQLSEGFVGAFVTGADLTAEIYTKLGVAANYKTDNLAKFYAHNGVAKYVDPASVGATQMTYKGYYANPLNSIKTNAEDIRQRLTGAMLSVDIAIAGANMQEMKDSGVAVQKAFYEILKAGVANLEEIYDRFLLEDYKFMTYNEMLLKSDDIVTFYGAKTGLADAMQQYLTAVSTAGAYGGDVAKDKDSKITSWTPGANAAEATLTNGKLVADISAVTINKYATSDSVETVKVGRDAMKQIDAYAAAATAKIENVAVKVNFLSYLETARMEWSDVFQGYYKAVKTANVNDFDTMIKLSLLSSEVDDTITVVEYYANHGGLELDTYKENYIEVLAMISNNDTHTALLSGKTIEQILADSSIAGKAFAEAQKAVKGLTDKPSDATWVVQPLVPTVAYTYVGSAVVDLDKIVNGAACYKKGNVTTKLYN